MGVLFLIGIAMKVVVDGVFVQIYALIHWFSPSVEKGNEDEVIAALLGAGILLYFGWGLTTSLLSGVRQVYFRWRKR
jgi:hypothetical protein